MAIKTNTEIYGIVAEVISVEAHPGILFYTIRYGPLYMRRITLWSDIDKSRDVIFYGQGNRRIGIRYDLETNELLGVWIAE